MIEKLNSARLIVELRHAIRDKGGDDRSLKEIADKLCIPIHRFRAAMQGKDDLNDYRLAIIAFLKTKNVRVDTEGKSVPPAPSPKSQINRPEPPARINLPKLPRPLIRELREFQTTIIQAQVGSNLVFCAITEREINGIHCLSLQEKEGCSGCSAPSRLCAVCLLRHVYFPEIDLCEICLKEELEYEKHKGIMGVNPMIKNHCQLTGYAVPFNVCHSMQGVNCGTCDSSWRLCTNCKDDFVYYPEHGFCLACAVKEFGSGSVQPTSPFTEKELDLLERLRDPKKYAIAAPADSKKTLADQPVKLPEPDVDSTPCGDDQKTSSAPKNNLTEEKIIKGFEEYLKLREVSPSSARNYIFIARQYFRFLESKKHAPNFRELRQPDPESINKFLTTRSKGKGKLSTATVNLRRSMLKSFFAYLEKLEKQGLSDSDAAIKFAKPPEKAKVIQLYPKKIDTTDAETDSKLTELEGLLMQYRGKNYAKFVELIHWAINKIRGNDKIKDKK